MDLVRNRLLELALEPLLWPLVFFLPCWILAAAAVYFKQRTGRAVASAYFWPGLGVIMLAWFAWANWKILILPAYTDHIQPQVAAVSWYFAGGHLLYHDAAAPEGYSMLYGPYLYIITALSEKIFGATIFYSKLPSILAAGLALGVLYFVFRQRAAVSMALGAAGLYAALLVVLGYFSLVVRSDAFLCLGVALGLWAALSRWRLAPLLFGVMVGICTNLKLHGFVYFLPLFWLAVRTGYTRKSWVLAGSGALVMLALPFVVLPNVSLVNYLWILRGAAGHGLDRSLLVTNLGWVGSVIAVALVWAVLVRMGNPTAVREYWQGQRPLFCLLGVTLLLVLVPASKTGSEPSHFLPWIISWLYAVMEMPSVNLLAARERSRWSLPLLAGIFSWLLSCFGSGYLLCYFQYQTASKQAPWAVSVETDLNSILQNQGKSYQVMMGLGDNSTYKFTKFRPLLVFGGQPLGFDAAALMDLQLAGIYRPDLRRMVAGVAAPGASSKGLMWLIPKGAEPFAEISSYPKMGFLFDDDFRKTFAQMFQLSDSSRYFDLYTARAAASARPPAK